MMLMGDGTIIEEIKKRQATYTTDNDEYRCPNCGETILAVPAFISLHSTLFSGCVGGGEVRKLQFPYCPNCDERPPNGEIRGCIHV